MPFDQVASLASRRTCALRSSFRPTYNMAANLVQRYPADVAHHLLNLSFAQFQTDRDVVGLERQLERNRRPGPTSRHRRGGPGDIDDYRRLSTALDDERRGRRTSGRGANAIERLKPGDVVVRAGRHGRVAVLGHERSRRGAPQVLALSESGELLRLGAADFDEPPTPARTHRAPGAVCPAPQRIPAHGRRSPPSRAGTAAARPGTRPAQGGSRRISKRSSRGIRLQAIGRAARYARPPRPNASSATWRASNGVCAAAASLARQFDRVLRVLEAWGYVELVGHGVGQHPGPPLQTDLVVAESLREGLLDDLDSAEIAAMVSCFTYERRGPDDAGPLPPDGGPPASCGGGGRSNASPRTSTTTRTTPACRRHVLDPGSFRTYTSGWRARTSPTCSPKTPT